MGRVVRILLPTLSPFPAARAPAIQVARVAQSFARRGHDVTLVTPAPSPDGPDLGGGDAHTLLADFLGFAPDFTVRTLATRVHRGQSYVNAVRLWRLVTETRPDACYARDLRGALVIASRGVPTVMELHTLAFLDSRQDRAAFRRLLRLESLRRVVVISAGLAEDLVAALPDEERLPGLLTIAHDGADLEAATDEPAPIDGRLRVAYTGSLYEGRGAGLIVELARRCPWAEVHVAGGPAGVAAALAADPSRPDNLVVHGSLTPAAVLALQRDAHVLVAPYAARVLTDTGVDSTRWASPMKLFEYMATGRAIVCSDLPVLREVIDDGVEALLAPPDDISAWTAALERLRDDAGLRARLGTAARERIAREFSWDVRAARVLDGIEPSPR